MTSLSVHLTKAVMEESQGNDELLSKPDWGIGLHSLPPGLAAQLLFRTGEG